MGQERTKNNKIKKLSRSVNETGNSIRREQGIASLRKKNKFGRILEDENCYQNSHQCWRAATAGPVIQC